MEIGDLVRVDYGESFGPLCVFLGRTQWSGRDGFSEWLILMDTQGRKFESHVDYIYPIKEKINESR